LNLSDLIAIQRDFDSKRSTTFAWSSAITGTDTRPLLHNVVSLAGEVGEIANLVKKYDRGDFDFESLNRELPGELADVMIYLMKLAYQSGIDLESAVLTKIAENESRFPAAGTTSVFDDPIFRASAVLAASLEENELAALRELFTRSRVRVPGSPTELVAAGCLAIRIGKMAELEGDRSGQDSVWESLQFSAESIGMSLDELVRLARYDLALLDLLSDCRPAEPVHTR